LVDERGAKDSKNNDENENQNEALMEKIIKDQLERVEMKFVIFNQYN
jgi:hypothetical protein